ncbi:rolling circle replication-associated protein [Algicola sagamiensis]|uniref:rolling circle replication-associated protein n=1 Tax=Algicola sagamiensis TaxID=163869 RepID=UPI00035FFD18|nr:hypothetical protein [Algicola sagamiensis]
MISLGDKFFEELRTYLRFSKFPQKPITYSLSRETKFYLRKESAQLERVGFIHRRSTALARHERDELDRLVKRSQSRTQVSEEEKPAIPYGTSCFVAYPGEKKLANRTKYIEHDENADLRNNLQEIIRRAKKQDGEEGSKENNEVDIYRPISCRFQHRQWNGEYRFLVHFTPSPGIKPPSSFGNRVTEKLGSKSVTKIIESSAYVQMKRGGYTTFLTPTFDEKTREKLANGELTIGKAISRLMDGLKKMRQRGWITNGECGSREYPWGEVECIGEPVVIPGDDSPFDYIWVAEAPENEKGESNPHCHILMRWKVEPKYFYQWAYRIERLWSHGFAKIERIRNENAAGSYILKAVGYTTKGNEEGQGKIYGNRYNISQPARAPGWENIASYETQHMLSIIAEIKAGMQKEKGKIYALQRERKKKQEEYKRIKGIKKNSTDKKYKSILKKMRERIGALNLDIRQKWTDIRQKPRCSDYCITFPNKQKCNEFIQYACGARHWSLKEIITQYDDVDHKEIHQGNDQITRDSANFWQGYWNETVRFLDRFDSIDPYQQSLNEFEELLNG